MRILKLLLASAVTLALVICLNRSWGTIPPLGKFLDPFHGFWQNAETGRLKALSINLPGLKDQVTILYDSVGIPHIFAKNDDDLYYAQGYVTAKDRLWQMEFQTHAGAGRISELIGSAALDYDRDQRRMGMVTGAQTNLDAVEKDPVAKSMVDHYTMGINSYIQSLNYERYPIEYKLLNYAPEPWTNLKSSLLLMNMAKTLNVGEKDFAMTNVLKLFGKETMDLLFPDNENVSDPIVDNKGKWNFKPITLDTVPLALPNGFINLPAEKFNHDVGSNNWAVSGSKTSTGSPMLCNDPHLNLTLPSIWYIIHLNAPGVNVMGASLPGAPTVISGFNDSIAWGVTNAQRDVVDWYRIKFKDGKKNEYFSDGRWKPTRKVIEKIVVRNGDPFYDTVIYTHHGPVRYDQHYHGELEQHDYAYRWISHDASQEYLAFYKLNRGKNHHDYMEALNYYSAPAQNFVFASVSGDIAMRIQGKFPVRRPGEGKFVLDGARTSQEWKAFIPNDQNVMYKNPERGFVSSANQYPADASYPYYINGDSYEAYRNRRINAVLAGKNNITPHDLMLLQSDCFNTKAAESLPVMLGYLDPAKFTEEESRAYSVLKSWDYYSTADAEAPAYYDAWWKIFYASIWNRIHASKVPLDYPTSYTTIKLIKEQPDLPFFDVDSTAQRETAREIIRQSFSGSVRRVNKWIDDRMLQTGSGVIYKGIAHEVRWADYKDTFIGHLLRGLPAFSYHVQQGGGSDIVNATTRSHGPSWRMVVSLEKNGVKAWGVYPGGQSGNPGSPFYNNMLDRWAGGRYFQFHFTTTAETLRPFSLGSTTLTASDK